MGVAKNSFLLGCLVVTSALLAGCPVGNPDAGFRIPMTVSCSRVDGGPCSLQTTPISQQLVETTSALRAVLPQQAMAIDPSSIYVDLVGTDYTTDATGSVAVTLYDAAGAIIVSQSFPWVKSGTRLVPQNPAALSAWIASYPTAANFQASVTPGNPPADGLDHTLSAAAYYQNVQIGEASRSFAATCVDPRTHHVSICAQ